MIERFQKNINQWLWAALLLGLPITSMPLVVRLVGSDSVASPAGIFLFLLVLTWLLPFILKGGRFSRLTLPLFVFIFAAAVSTALSVFLPIPNFRDISILRSDGVALITLAVGVCFYLVVSTYGAESGRLEKALRLINLAGFVVLGWCLVQAAAWRLLHGYPQAMRDFHDLYSVGPLYNNRVSGFALEPSWLAHQLNILFLPYWLGATVRRYSSQRLRFLGLTVENVLLAGGMAALLLSLSRIGLGAFLLTLAYLLLRGNIRLVRWLQSKAAQKLGWQAGTARAKKAAVSLAISLGLILVYVLLVMGLLFGMSKVDPRMKDVFSLSLHNENGILNYANALNFSSRVVYWEAGWNVFNDYPLLGVGLGNAGYFFPEKLSPFAWKLTEVRDLIYRSGSVLNSKCLWVRLLSETGIIGFAVFIGWLFALWQAAGMLEHKSEALWKTVGMAGKFTLLALLLEGFSIDSFALPYLWASAGILTAGWVCAFQTNCFHSGINRNKGENFEIIK